MDHLLKLSLDQLAELAAAGAVKMATRYEYHGASYTEAGRDPWAPYSTHFLDKGGREVAFFNHELLPYTGLVKVEDLRLWKQDDLHHAQVAEIRELLVDQLTRAHTAAQQVCFIAPRRHQ